MKKTFAVISHTHWDREWYQPFELFRFRLVDMMDNLLSTLKEYPTYRFHLDAQTIVLEDYLSIRPEKRSLLKKYIKEGRLLVGPWYVQNDFNLTSGEATVRNLMLGQKIADDFGKCTRIAYMADQFGLTSQLPQIFLSCGMDTCLFGRGANDKDMPAQLYWQGADGSTVLCEFMKWWYNNLQRLPTDTAEATKLILRKTDAMTPYMKTHNYLLMNGVDHLEAQEDLLPILEAVRANLPDDVELIQDTLPAFVERTKADIRENGLSLPTLHGELRIGGEKKVLTGTLSSRIYLKIANTRAQVALEKRVEPLYALLHANKIAEYPSGYLSYLWKLLLENHPHDSICGCSVDAVHAHMMDRFVRIEEITDELLRRGMQAISDHLEKKHAAATDYFLTVLNTVSFDGKALINAEVMIPTADGVSAFRLLSPTGEEIPFTVYDIGHQNHSSISPINLPGDLSVTRYFIRFLLPLCGIGYQALTVRPCEGSLTVESAANATPDVLENEFIHCKICKNGTLTVTDKRCGKVYDGLLLIEDSPESGDAYVHHEPDGARHFTSEAAHATVSVVENNRFLQSRRVTYDVPLQRDDEKTLSFDVLLSLPAHTAVIDVQMRFENTAKDHRIQVLFPTGIACDGVYAAAPFDRVKHGLYEDDNDRRRPNSGYIAVSDGKCGLAVLNEGLYEYEHKADKRSTLALTVLRATGNFAWYKDKSTIAKDWICPEAQCLHENSVHFALYPFEGDVDSARVSAHAELFLTPPLSHAAPVDMRKLLCGRPFVQATDIGGCIFFREPKKANVHLPHTASFFKIEGDGGRAVVSACKKAEGSTGTVLRLYNPTEEPLALTITLSRAPRSVKQLSIDERSTLPMTPARDGNTLSPVLKPKEIVTLLIQ